MSWHVLLSRLPVVQMSTLTLQICIRVLDNKVEVNGNFLFFFESEGTKSMKLVNKVKGILLNFDFSIQGYHRASNMMMMKKKPGLVRTFKKTKKTPR